MQYTIIGEIAQSVHLKPKAGELVWASKGSLVTHSPGVSWELKIPGGMGGAVRRSFAGEGLSLARINVVDDDQDLVLTSNQPGHITTWNLEDGPVLTTRGAFLAAWGEEVDITVSVAKRAGAAFFGGAGLFLQRVSGKGIVLVHGSGDFYEQRLGEGEEITVSTGNLAAFSYGVDYDIRGVAGMRRILFGGEGLFMTRLTGPGRILLQTLKRRQSGRQQ